jgi:hypothetical protein
MILARSLCRLYQVRDLLRERLRHYLGGFVGIVMLYMLGWSGISKFPEVYPGK